MCIALVPAHNCCELEWLCEFRLSSMKIMLGTKSACFRKRSNKISKLELSLSVQFDETLKILCSEETTDF